MRDRGSVEIDIVAPLVGGDRYLTGSIKWGAEPRAVGDYFEHVRSLERLSQSGHAWAVRALDSGSPMLFAAAGGFDSEFAPVAVKDGRVVYLWTLEDVYGSGS